MDPAPQPQPAATPTPSSAPAWEQTALGELGKLSQQIVASVQEGLVVYDGELRYTLWNPFMEKLTGQPASEVLGKHALDIHPQWKRLGIDTLLQRALAGHASSIVDVPYSQTRTGWSGWISVRALPLRNSHGEIFGVLSVLQDITKRKRAEEALVANELRYRQLFEDNPQPMFVYDLETMAFLAVNDAAIRHYGYAREEFMFMNMNDLLAPVEEASAAGAGAPAKAGFDEARLWRHRTRDTRIIDVEISSHVIDFSGRRAVLVLANDVTVRLQAEAALRESEAKYRTLIEAADVAILLADAGTGRITHANRRAETLLGLSRPQIIGLHQSELHPPEAVARYREAFLKFAALQGRLPREGLVWHRAGRRIAVDINASLFELGGSKVVQMILRDITERKRSEESLAHKSRQFEVLSLANRQLIAVLELPRILRTLVSAGMDLVEGTVGTVGLLADDKLVFTEFNAKGAWQPLPFQFASGQGVAGYVLSSKLPYLCNEPEQDPLVVADFSKALGSYNLISVPILNHERKLLGCVEVHNAAGRRLFDDGDLTMLECLAGSAAIAIENAQMAAAGRQSEAQLARSHALQAATLESIPDGVLVIDTQGHIAGYNQAFVQLWRLPPAIVEARDDAQARNHALSQLQDPAGFQAQVKEIYAHPEAESHDHIEFKDGRVFERFSKPQRVGGEVVGRVWTFRDVTALRAAPKAKRKRS